MAGEGPLLYKQATQVGVEKSEDANDIYTIHRLRACQTLKTPLLKCNRKTIGFLGIISENLKETWDPVNGGEATLE